MLKGDFYTQVKYDMDLLNMSETDILTRNESELKTELTSRIQKAAYEYLMEKARNHSKTRNELYKDLGGSSYLSDHRFRPDLAKIVFCFRTRTYRVKNNFRNHYKEDLLCTLCEDEICQQSHIFQCEVIRRVVGQVKAQYEDLFSDDIDKLFEAAKTLKQLVEIREILLDP